MHFWYARALWAALGIAAAMPLSFGATAFAQDETAGSETERETPIAREMDGPFIVIWATGNLRAGPSSEAELLARLTLGTVVTVTGEVAGGAWYRVETAEGRRGYIWRDVLAALRLDLPLAAADRRPVGPGLTLLPASQDNARESANPTGDIYAAPAVFTGMVGPEDDRDYYRIEIPAWSELSVLLGDLGADADLILEDEFGAEIATASNGGTDPDRLSIPVAPGNYFLMVYHYESGTNYRLEISALRSDPPPADTAGSGFPSARDLGALGSDAIMVEEWLGGQDPQDFFVFSLARQQRVAVSLEGLASDVDLYLYSETQGLLYSSEAGGNMPESIVATLPPGSYYLSTALLDSTPSGYTLSLFAGE